MESAASPYHDLGPVLPPAALVRPVAREVLALAQRAVEFSAAGPRQDLAAALVQFERIRALLGGEERRDG